MQDNQAIKESKMVLAFLDKQIAAAKAVKANVVRELIRGYFPTQFNDLEISENTTVRILTAGTYILKRDNYLQAISMKSIGKSHGEVSGAYSEDQEDDCDATNPENPSGCFLVSDCGSVIAYYLRSDGYSSQPSSFELYPTDQVYLLTVRDED